MRRLFWIRCLTLAFLTGWTQAVLYPYGDEQLDGNVTNGDDFTAATFRDNFRLYGTDHNIMYVNSNGYLAFGLERKVPITFTSAAPTPYIAGYSHDYLYTTEDLGKRSGVVYFRKTSDVATLAQAQADLLLAKHTSSLDVAYVITYYLVQPFSDSDKRQNTVQTVLCTAKKGTEMYAIFNYDTTVWGPDAVAAVNKGDLSNIVNLPISGHDMTSASTFTNVGVPGRAVLRLDDAHMDQTPVDNAVPEAKFKSSESTISGAVTMFDSNKAQLPGNSNVVFSNTVGNRTDPCKYRLKVVTHGDGSIDWLAMNVAVHANPNKFKRSYAFNKTKNVIERGQGIKARTIKHYPYSWRSRGTLITIVKDGTTGWKLSGGGDCSYSMTFRPNGPEPALTLTLGYEFKARVIAGISGEPFDH